MKVSTVLSDCKILEPCRRGHPQQSCRVYAQSNLLMRLTSSRAGRRAANNRIRGPQSALTDFLAANNISAAQIAADYERRIREVQGQEQQEAAADGEAAEQDVKEEEDEEQEEDPETAAQKKKRKRREEAAVIKIKNNKAKKKQKKGNGGDSDGDDDVAWDMYTKKQPLPGQLENCEKCEKRFTVTPYSKTGPDGGLLCAKCSIEQEAQKKKDQKKPKAKAVSREKRRQVQSNLLDGIVQVGAKSLQDICIKVSTVHNCALLRQDHTDGM